MAKGLKPDDLAKSGTEHGEQRAFFAWLLANNRPVWELTFAIPNGGARGNDQRTAAIRGAGMKAEGVKPGVPDIMCAMPFNGNPYEYASGYWTKQQRGYAGLFIEMKRGAKRGSAGRVALKQDPWHEALEGQGYAVAVAHSWREAAGALLTYFGVPLDMQPRIVEAWPATIGGDPSGGSQA